LRRIEVNCDNDTDVNPYIKKDIRPLTPFYHNYGP
jgi:hypothetical protein